MPLLLDDIPVVGRPNVEGGQVLLTGRGVRGASPTKIRVIVSSTIGGVAVEELRCRGGLRNDRFRTLDPLTTTGSSRDVHEGISGIRGNRLVLDNQARESRAIHCRNSPIG